MAGIYTEQVELQVSLPVFGGAEPSLLPLEPEPVTLILDPTHATEGKSPVLVVGSQGVTPQSPQPW